MVQNRNQGSVTHSQIRLRNIATNPETTGDIVRSGSDVLVHSGGVVRNLSQVPSLYEEGTFTPVLHDADFTDTKGQSYINQDGYYTRIGNRVFYELSMTVSSLGSLTTNDPAYIAGLPYTVSNKTEAYGSAIVGYADSMLLSTGQPRQGGITGIAVPNTKRMILELWDSLNGVTDLQISEYSAGGYVLVTGHYQTTE